MLDKIKIINRLRKEISKFGNIKREDYSLAEYVDIKTRQSLSAEIICDISSGEFDVKESKDAG